MKLSDRVAIVTGGGSGIGQETASEGAKVVVVDWNRESGQATAQGIRESGSQAEFCYADVSKAKDVEAMVASTMNKYGQLDFVFNNAAVQIISQLVETTEET